MLDDLPPVAQILLREPPRPEHLKGPDEFRRYLKRLFPELRRQAEWTLNNFAYPQDATDPRIKGFVIRPSTGLDPFSHFAKCSHPECRLLNALHVARSIGLYGDTVMLADRLTTAVLYTRRLSEANLPWLATLITVLLTLRPLFEAGVFRFYKSARTYCAVHRRQFFNQIDDATEEVLVQIKDQIHFELKGKVLGIHDRILHEPPLVLATPLSKKHLLRIRRGTPLEVIGLEAARASISDEVFESFLDLQNASDFRAVTFSNSRISLLTAQYVEKTAPRHADLEVWEATRSAVLPWVRDLTVAQVVQLRNEAADALPRLRSALGTAMTAQSADPNRLKRTVAALREEAEEVSAELKSLNLPQRKHDRTGLGLLGMTLSIYGMAGDMPLQAVALTGLIGLLGLLHTTRRSDHHEHQKLISRPGYVLVKAKELAEHA